VYVGLAFWMCHIAAQARNGLKVMASVVALASFVACAVALYYFSGNLWKYPFGIHGGSGNHSSVLLFLMPPALLCAAFAFLGGAPRWVGGVAAGLVLLYAVSAYGTLNRTVWLGFALQVALVFALARSHVRVQGRRAAIVVVAVCVLIAAGTAGILWKIHDSRASYGGVAVEKDLRFTVWPEALERIRERPLAGYGFGRGLLRKELTRDANSEVAWHTHNLFLDTLVQSGAIGLLLLLALLGATVREGWKAIRRGDPLALACGGAIVALVAGMLVRNMTDVLWVRHIALLYWGGLGALLAWGGATGRQTAA
jgi:O-antigen ligase